MPPLPAFKCILAISTNIFYSQGTSLKFLPLEQIAQVLLLPYLRIVKKDTYIKDIRLCIFTNKGQIFHNKPARAIEIDGPSRPNDVIHFEESVVWDIPGRKHPSESPTPDEYECYYPGLPVDCYKYSPIDNQNPSFRNEYGNGGFGKFKKVVVDGKILDEPYIKEAAKYTYGMSHRYVVPQGKIFVMGDNRNHSADSRDIRVGMIDEDYVMGKVVYKFGDTGLFNS